LWLDLLKGTWTRSDVVRFLSIFPFSPRWLEEMSMGKPADWDLWTREAMVVSGEDQLFYRLSVLSKQYDKRGRAESQHIRKFVGFLQEWMLRWKIYEASNKPTWSRVGENMADAFLLPSVVETDAEAVEKICTSLADLDDFDTSPSLTTVTKVTRQRLQAASLQSNRQVFERDGLYVGSLVSARGIGFDMVCIPGLAERIFPAPPKPDPILLDSERTEINVATKGKLSLRSERLAEERSLFDLALRQGKFASLLSYARQSTGDQRERRPSAFFVRTVEKCRTRVASRALLKWTAVEQEPFIDVRDWVARDLGRRLVQKDLGVEEQLPSITPFAGPVRSWVNDRLGEKQWTSYDGVVHFDRGRALTSKAFSATEISTYATCPYRYYLRYVLNIRPVEKPDETKELRPIDRGDLIHEILFRLYSELREKRMLPLSLEGKAEAEARLKRIADVVFESAETRLPLGLQVLWSTEKNLILSDLHAFLSIDFEESANFVPLAFEVRFGRSVRNEYEDLTFSSDQPVSYALGDREESILLQGKIDRLDISPDRKRARIIDYKTGELKEARDEALNGGKSVQLPIYLSALGNLLPDVALEASEAVLWSTSYGGGFRRVSFSGQTFRAREIEFRKVLSTFKKGSGAGYFPPNPGDHLEHCEHCDFRGVCGWVIKSIAERKRNDPALSFIFDLESIP
jgi:RecB family exonuclease